MTFYSFFPQKIVQFVSSLIEKLEVLLKISKLNASISDLENNITRNYQKIEALYFARTTWSDEPLTKILPLCQEIIAYKKDIIQINKQIDHLKKPL